MSLKGQLYSLPGVQNYDVLLKQLISPSSLCSWLGTLENNDRDGESILFSGFFYFEDGGIYTVDL